MDHGYYKDRISGYLDGELPDYEMEAIRRHLAECAECRELHEKLERLEQLVDRKAGIGGENDYWEAAALRIEQRIGIAAEPEVIAIPPKRNRSLAWKLVGVAASLAALTFIGVNYTDILRQREAEEASAPNEMRAPGVPRDTVVSEPAPTTMKDEDAVVQTQERVGQQTPARDAYLAEEGQAAGAAESPQQAVTLEKPQAASPEPGAREKLSVSEEKAAAEIEEHEAIPEPVLDKAMTAKAPSPAETLVAGEGTDTPPTAPAEKREVRLSKESVKALAPSLSLADTLRVERDARGLLPQTAAPSPEKFSMTAAEGVRTVTLADWQHRRDSLELVWGELRSSHLQLTLPKGRKDRAALSDIDLVERQLLEAQVQIGRLATPADSLVRAQAIGFLRSYLELSGARHRETARLYLEELQADSADTDERRR